MEGLTLFERIKAMDFYQMVDFFLNYNDEEAANFNCSKCMYEHNGNCAMDEIDQFGCMYDPKTTIARWLMKKEGETYEKS